MINEYYVDEHGQLVPIIKPSQESVEIKELKQEIIIANQLITELQLILLEKGVM